MPPTGKNCRMETQNDMKDSDNDINLKELAKVQKRGSKAEDKSGSILDRSVDTSEEEVDGDTVQLQILAELRRVNARLDAVEDKVESNSSSSGGAHQKERQHKNEQSKFSSKSSGSHCDKKSSKRKQIVVESDSETNSDNSIPDLHVLRSSEII